MAPWWSRYVQKTGHTQTRSVTLTPHPSTGSSWLKSPFTYLFTKNLNLFISISIYLDLRIFLCILFIPIKPCLYPSYQSVSFFFFSFYLFIWLSISPTIDLSKFIDIYLSPIISIYQSIHPSWYLYIYLSIHL